MQNKYPVVLCHGMFGFGQQEITERVLPYYGLWNVHIRKMFDKEGVHCVAPSLGPYNGAWDRACELYAQLVGGRVDYGKVHSAKYGHERYGRKYKALLPEWGKKDKDGNIIKINLIGHSFGGVTARLLTELLINGSKEEIEGTPANELSPLFKGGNRNLVHSITTLASPHNGASIGEKTTGKVIVALCIKICQLFNIVDSTPLQRIYDLNLDRFGITTPPSLTKFKIENKDEEIKKYFKDNTDNIVYDLSYKGSEELNNKIEVQDNIYYFSYRGQRTEPKLHGLIQWPGAHSFPVLLPFGIIMGVNRIEAPSADWLANDLVINTISGTAPSNAKSVDFTSVTEYKPGIWHVMPLEVKDHMSYLGWAEDKNVYRDFYHDIYNRVSSLPTINK